MPRGSIKDKEQYQALRREGASKEKAARIANASARESRSAVGRRGGHASDYEDLSKQQLYDRARQVADRRPLDDEQGRADRCLAPSLRQTIAAARELAALVRAGEHRHPLVDRVLVGGERPRPEVWRCETALHRLAGAPVLPVGDVPEVHGVRRVDAAPTSGEQPAALDPGAVRGERDDPVGHHVVGVSLRPAGSGTGPTYAHLTSARRRRDRSTVDCARRATSCRRASRRSIVPPTQLPGRS